MMIHEGPLSKAKDDYDELIRHISNPDSPVGIDAQLTHAIIIDYLRDISKRLERIESQLETK